MKTLDNQAYYNLSETAYELQIDPGTLRTAIQSRHVPQAETVIGKRRHYSRWEIDAVLRPYFQDRNRRKQSNWQNRVEREKGLLTIRRAAKLLGVKHITFSVWLQKGRVPRPQTRSGCNWYYAPHEIEALKKLITSWSVPDGYLNVRQFSEQIGLKPFTVSWHINKGFGGKLGTVHGHHRLLSPDDQAKLRAYLDAKTRRCA